jgi:hypothetical protein
MYDCIINRTLSTAPRQAMSRYRKCRTHLRPVDYALIEGLDYFTSYWCQSLVM